ncbi:MAG: hypothetical protein R3E53_14055 [Myxococcota bacterium]
MVDVDDARGQGVDEVPIVGDEEHRPFVGAEGLLEHLAGLDVEMDGRLVEDEQVGRPQQRLHG